MASTLYVASDGVSGPPGVGEIGGPPGWPPTGFNGCWVWATPVTTRPSGSNPETASGETVTIAATAARNTAFATELRPVAVTFPVMLVFCVMAAGFLANC